MEIAPGEGARLIHKDPVVDEARDGSGDPLKGPLTHDPQEPPGQEPAVEGRG